MRYVLSLLIPMPMKSVYAAAVAGAQVKNGGHGSHFRDDDHHDLTRVTWWQWRGHAFRSRTTTCCIG